MKNWILVLLVSLTVVACDLDQSYPSAQISDYKSKNGTSYAKNAGQVNFVFESLGSLCLEDLFNQNILPIKVYATALMMMDPLTKDKKLDHKILPVVMQKYGFIHPEKIANWRSDLSPEPKIEGSLGFISTSMKQNIGGQLFKLEAANITCAACHSSVTYDATGMPQKMAWLGAGNTSLNLDGFLNQVYQGLKKGMSDPANFMAKIREAYPEMDSQEDETIRKSLFPKIVEALKDFRTLDRVLPFANGGAGHTNGIAAFKRDAKLLVNPFQYHEEEAGIVGIPNITDRGFRSSFTTDGAYGARGKERYRSISSQEANDPNHLGEMASIAAFFSYSAMGNNLKNIEANIPRVKEIMALFIKGARPAPFPGTIDKESALKGEKIFKSSCAKCHGDYSPGLESISLLSFPNKFVSETDIGTDPNRWMSVSKNIIDFANANIFAKYIDAGFNLNGYTAPLLSGLWYKAPYLHNGSVPTLWQLMNPRLRPQRFLVGGHAIDMEDIGIKGVQVASWGQVYPYGYEPWSEPTVFDTSEKGKSNLGHERPFDRLSEEEKRQLLEYLKLL